ncbi:MAG: hypothetical protein HY262_09545 [Chloroflexi bacterium]|nr:hypothetical protein [Chloroflexota bacterium]
MDTRASAKEEVDPTRLGPRDDLAHGRGLLVVEGSRQMELVDWSDDPVQERVEQRSAPVRDKRPRLDRSDKPWCADLGVAPAVAYGRVVDRSDEIVHPGTPASDRPQIGGIGSIEPAEQLLAGLETAHRQVA